LSITIKQKTLLGLTLDKPKILMTEFKVTKTAEENQQKRLNIGF
jgi:hypothetical protein